MRTRAAALLTALLIALSPVVAPPLPAGATGVKPMLRGLLDRKGVPAVDQMHKLDAFVVKTEWSALQPTAFGPIARNNPIDQALAVIRSDPRAAHLKVKLRVYAGIEAPDWAKQLAGGPVNVYKGNHVFTMGKFWTREFRDAYNNLQRRLAARYDAVPEILETVISRCTIIHAEPFLRAGRPDQRTRDSLLAAGFTPSLDAACHKEEIAAHKVWATTRSGLAVDPYDRIAADGSYVEDVAFTEKMMAYCRTALGPRCVLENNSISSPLLPDPYPRMYARMRSLGAPLGFQTRNPELIGDWYATLDWAVEQGANFVELNTSYPTYDPDALESIRRRLVANPAP